jgi:CheY-like chemotaxis protein
MSDDLVSILRVGQQVLIHFGARASDAVRHSTIVRGWVNRSYLMLDAPIVDGKAMPVVLGAPCVIRFLAEGTACGFSSSIVYAKRNETIFRIAWPTDVEFAVVRKHERVNTTLRCTVHGVARGPYAAEMIDLSTGGCRVHSSASVDPGSMISLTIETGPDKTLGPIKTVVRNTLVRGAGYSLGCQFEKLDETLRLEIEGLVTLRMQSMRANSESALRIILVGSNLLFIEAVRQVLVAAQCEVILAAGAIDAFHYLRSTHVNVLIAEWKQPDLPGSEICRVIRATKEFQELPVILFGGASGDKTSADNAGASRFFTAAAEPKDVAQTALEYGAASPATPAASA